MIDYSSFIQEKETIHNKNNKIKPRILAISTSRNRPSFVRYCALQMKHQTVSIDHAIFLNTHKLEETRNFISLLTDIEPNHNLFLAWGESTAPHHNHCIAMYLAPSLADYDVVLKVDDDDVYRSDYAEKVLEDFDKHKWGFSGTLSEGLLLDDMWISSKKFKSPGVNKPMQNLDVKEMMPGSIALDKEQVKNVMNLDIAFNEKVFEDVLWKIYFNASKNVKICMRAKSSFAYHIHKKNYSPAKTDEQKPNLKLGIEKQFGIYKEIKTIGGTLNKKPRVLAFTTSSVRPSYLRKCVMEMVGQSIPVDHAIYVNHAQSDDFNFNYSDLIKDFEKETDSTIYYGYGDDLGHHNNHLAALALAPLSQYDLFLKIDDDDVYRGNYAESVLKEFDAMPFDFSGCVSDGVIISTEWFENVKLKENHESGNRQVSFSYAFSKKGIEGLSNIHVNHQKNYHKEWLDYFLKHESEFNVMERKESNTSFVVHGQNQDWNITLCKTSD